jgi:hypothetical protein
MTWTQEVANQCCYFLIESALSSLNTDGRQCLLHVDTQRFLEVYPAYHWPVSSFLTIGYNKYAECALQAA